MARDARLPEQLAAMRDVRDAAVRAAFGESSERMFPATGNRRGVNRPPARTSSRKGTAPNRLVRLATLCRPSTALVVVAYRRLRHTPIRYTAFRFQGGFK
jgi:hypothetical protein